MPTAEGVKVTWQLPEVRVQLGGVLREPGPVEVKLTVPVGVVDPDVEVSSTLAVQVEAWPTTTGLTQVRLVDVS